MQPSKRILDNQARGPEAVMQAVESAGPQARHALHHSVSWMLVRSHQMYCLTLSYGCIPAQHVQPASSCSNIRQRCMHTAANWLHLRHRSQRCGSKLQICMRRGPQQKP